MITRIQTAPCDLAGIVIRCSPISETSLSVAIRKDGSRPASEDIWIAAIYIPNDPNPIHRLRHPGVALREELVEHGILQAEASRLRLIDPERHLQYVRTIASHRQALVNILINRLPIHNMSRLPYHGLYVPKALLSYQTRWNLPQLNIACQSVINFWREYTHLVIENKIPR